MATVSTKLPKALISEIKRTITIASSRKHKLAMFHYQILANADLVKDVNATDLCRELNMPETYRSELTKMLALARILGDVNARLVLPP